jgi:hypothetical protein
MVARQFCRIRGGKAGSSARGEPYPGRGGAGLICLKRKPSRGAPLFNGGSGEPRIGTGIGWRPGGAAAAAQELEDLENRFASEACRS